MGFSGGSDSKELTCSGGDLGSISGLGRSPGGGHGNTLQYSCLENPHGQRSPVGYSPWGHKESDMTEQQSTAQYTTVTSCHQCEKFLESCQCTKVFINEYVFQFDFSNKQNTEK